MKKKIGFFQVDIDSRNLTPDDLKEKFGEIYPIFKNDGITFEDIDLFKYGVSLPGLVLKYLTKETESDFYLFDEGYKTIIKD